MAARVRSALREMHSAFTRSDQKALAVTITGQPSDLFSCAPLVHEN